MPYCPPVNVQVPEKRQIEAPRQNQPPVQVQEKRQFEAPRQATGSRPISEQKGAIFNNPPQVVDSFSFPREGERSNLQGMTVTENKG